jgi:hypothetical protein
MNEHEPDPWLAEYEKAANEALEEGLAIIDKAIKKAEARRRFHVDSQGRTVIAYVDPVVDDEEAGR